MANIIIDYSLKENVFKDNDFVFSDLKMPMTIDYKNREYKINTDFEAVRGGINNIFYWLPGQRILYPTFGNLIYNYLTELINDVTSKNIKGAIITMFEWDRRVTLKDILIEPDPDNNQYNVSISYYIPSLNKTIETKFTVITISQLLAPGQSSLIFKEHVITEGYKENN